MKCKKKLKESFKAFKLGENSPMEYELLKSGKIQQNKDGTYAILSRETDGNSGELAKPGDYVKIDTSGYPYPNKKEVFERECVSIGGNLYQQSGSVVEAWFADDPVSEFVLFLTETHRLVIDQTDEKRYFRANLWGTVLSAPRDAAVIAYTITRDTGGKIVDVDFNFVDRQEFERTYEICI